MTWNDKSLCPTSETIRKSTWHDIWRFVCRITFVIVNCFSFSNHMKSMNYDCGQFQLNSVWHLTPGAHCKFYTTIFHHFSCDNNVHFSSFSLVPNSIATILWERVQLEHSSTRLKWVVQKQKIINRHLPSWPVKKGSAK